MQQWRTVSENLTIEEKWKRIETTLKKAADKAIGPTLKSGSCNF